MGIEVKRNMSKKCWTPMEYVLQERNDLERKNKELNEKVSEALREKGKLEEENEILLCELYDLKEERIKLKCEISMLQMTIGRNEAYIRRLEHKGVWRK